MGAFQHWNRNYSEKKERRVLDLVVCLLHEELLKAFGCVCLKHSDSNDKQFEVLFRVKLVSGVRCLHMKFSQQQKYWRCVIPCSVLPWGPGTQNVLTEFIIIQAWPKEKSVLIENI